MVYRYTRGKRNKRLGRRMYRKRYNKTHRSIVKRNHVSNITKTLSAGFPPTMMTRLRYCEAITINPPALSQLGQYIYNANNLFDPNYTGVGHQPLGRDIYAGIYKNYMVVGAKITARFQSTDNDQNVLSMVGIKISSDAALPTTAPMDIMEQGINRYKFLTNDSAYKGSNVIKTCVARWSGKKWFGWKDWRDNTASYSAPMGGAPTERVYFILYAGDTDGNNALDLDPFRVVVTVDYIVYFNELIEQAQN